jgi:hypothetical protein
VLDPSSEWGVFKTVLIEVERGKTPEPANARGRHRLEWQPGFGAADDIAGLEFRIPEWSCFASIASGSQAREASLEPRVWKCKLRATLVRALWLRPQQSLLTPGANACVPFAVVCKLSCPPRRPDAPMTAKSLW